MDDRELLEKAAKAAGLTLTWNGDNPPYPRAKVGSQNLPWNPLTDDGDALRLAVTLEIEICFFPGFREIRAEPASVYAMSSATENYAEDMGAATRRAIVRAAAACLGTQGEDSHG